MSNIDIPFYSINGLSKTVVGTLSVDDTNIKKCQSIGNDNSYRTFFEKDNLEEYIKSYPKTQVEMKVLCRVSVPD